MWRKIDSKKIIEQIKDGDIISTNPAETSPTEFEIKKIEEGAIKAINYDSIVKLKIFPEEDLILGNWWLKE